jgi:hypothetical protein
LKDAFGSWNGDVGIVAITMLDVVGIMDEISLDFDIIKDVYIVGLGLYETE